MDWERGWKEWLEGVKTGGPGTWKDGPDEMRALPTDELVYRLVALRGHMACSIGSSEVREEHRLLAVLNERGLSERDKESIAALVRQVEAKCKEESAVLCGDSVGGTAG